MKNPETLTPEKLVILISYPHALNERATTFLQNWIDTNPVLALQIFENRIIISTELHNRLNRIVCNAFLCVTT
jgi:hypothetical protein